MTNIYAKVPQSKPENAAVYQLKPVDHNGYKFYGWKMVFFKQVPSGNKTKSGRIKYKNVINTSIPAVYDQTSQQLMINQQNSNAISSILLNNAKNLLQSKQLNQQQTNINSQTLLKLANQLIQNKQQNKINSQLMMQVASLEVQLKNNK